MAKYDVFISYRREGGYDTAKHLYDLLTRDGYKVSFDIDTLRNGDFDTSLLKRIDECKDFILIVDAHAFDRTLDPNFNPKNDWLRQELAYALKKGKNVVPIFLHGVQGFPIGLPDDVAGVVRKNGPKYDRYYFNDFYRRLKESFLLTKSKKKTYLTLAIVIIGIVVLCYAFDTQDSNSISENEVITGLTSDSIGENVESYKEVAETKEVDYKTKLKRFCGSYSYVIPNAGFGGVNYVYELVLDPVNSTCTVQEEGFVNIKNAKGYYGTMMQMPEYWEVQSFSVSQDGSHAIVSMHGGDNCICKVKLELDDYNNIKMSFIEGTDGPGVLYDDNGGMTSVVTFVRDS